MKISHKIANEMLILTT